MGDVTPAVTMADYSTVNNKKKEKTTPFGIATSQVLYQAAQSVHDILYANATKQLPCLQNRAR